MTRQDIRSDIGSLDRTVGGVSSPIVNDGTPTDPGATIRRLTTVEVDDHPNLLWVMVETDDGTTGLGETFLHADAVATYLHSTVAPYLLGTSALDVNRHWVALFHQWGRGGMGTESRGASAVDIALWDALGRRYGLPLHQLLGGRTRDAIPVYNTCAGPTYVRDVARPNDLLFGLDGADGQYEDLVATMRDPGGLAEDLLASGIRGMKIWPFDTAAVSSRGNWISPEQLRDGLWPLEQIRAAVDDRMSVAVELHAKWSLTPATTIARAVEPLAPMWIEDPMRLDNLAALRELSRESNVPIAVSERLGDRYAYLPLLETGAVGIVMTDASWVGGVSEARRVADLASLYQRPFTPHDCTGPVSLAVGVHLCLTAETAIFQEIVRAFYHGWYHENVTGLPPLHDGMMTATAASGHGIELRHELLERAAVRTSELRADGRIQLASA